ncbi:MAG: DUF167 domain-containing protein [Rhodospirillales bacterium]|nr:DUF167 domain-containing protein [Rhodospirillales bacterium]
MNNPPSPFTASKHGVRVAVRVIPKASRVGIDGVATGADGTAYLKVRVTMAPDKGKANTAVLKLLAKSWGFPLRDIAVVAGSAARNKVLEVEGPPAVLLRDLGEWLKQQTGET